MIKLYQSSYKARRWIKFAVIPSFIPIVFVIIYDTILGYNFKNIINRHLIDFILVVFAVAVSVFGTAIDLHKKIRSETDEEKSENYVLFSLAVGLWCTAFFTFLYDKLKPEDNLSFKKIIFCLVQIGITFIIVYKGMQAENELELLSQAISIMIITILKPKRRRRTNLMFNKKKRLIICVTFALFIIIFLWNALNQRKYMLTLYRSAIDKVNNEEYKEAQEILRQLGDYKDSFDQIEIAQDLEYKKEIYNKAVVLFNNEDYENAIELFTQIKDFKDSENYIKDATKLIEQKNANENIYITAYDNYESNDYISAIQEFSTLNGYKDSEVMIQECRLELARLQQATTISAGIRSSVGMIRNGKVYLAGDDYYSWRSILDTWNDIISISVKGNFVVGLKEDGTVVMAGKVPEYYVGTKT